MTNTTTRDQVQDQGQRLEITIETKSDDSMTLTIPALKSQQGAGLVVPHTTACLNGIYWFMVIMAVCWFIGWMCFSVTQSNISCWISLLIGTNVHEKSRSDFCRLRFKTDGLSRMYALSRDVTAPGVVVYDSGLSVNLPASVTVL